MAGDLNGKIFLQTSVNAIRIKPKRMGFMRLRTEVLVVVVFQNKVKVQSVGSNWFRTAAFGRYSHKAFD